jgi:hypothetical protein
VPDHPRQSHSRVDPKACLIVCAIGRAGEGQDRDTPTRPLDGKLGHSALFLNRKTVTASFLQYPMNVILHGLGR